MNKYIKYTFLGVLTVWMGFSISCTEEEPINLPPSFKLTGVSDVMRTTATFAGTVSGDVSSIKSYGFEYSTSENFPGDQTWTLEMNGTPSSSVIATATGLEANERYYYRLFATTGASKVFSSAEYFQTLSSSAPLLSALEVDSIGENIARFRCTVEDIGDEYLLEYGVSYKKVSDQAYVPVPSDSIVAGTSNTYFVEIIDLDPATKYMFRPYAKNSADATGETGAREGYGSVIEEKTQDQKSAVVTTSEIVSGNIGINSVTVSGMVKSANASNGKVDACGFCWSSKNATPVITDDALEMAPTNIGEYFTATITDLEPKTLYYVRAFARNTVNGEERIGYGEVYELTTGSLITPRLEVEMQDNGDGTYSPSYVITATSIRYKANITNYDEEALVDKGLIWSTSDGSITLSKAKENKTVLSLDLKTGGRMIDGTIDNLEMNTRYYLRAYAVYQAAGMEEIGYTDVMSFHTNDFELPRLEQTEVKDITRYSATLIGAMSSSGNGELLEKGFVLSEIRETYEPTLNMEGVKVIISDDDSFTEKIDGLEHGTEYAVRTYAIAKLAERVDTTYAWYTHFATESINFPSFNGSGSYGTDEGIALYTSLNKGDGEITEVGYIWRVHNDDNKSDLTIETCEEQKILEIENYNDFTIIITNLKPNSTIDFAMYIKSKIDGREYINYGCHWTFNTGDPKTPNLNYINYESATITSVTVSCGISKEGEGEVIEKGFVWLKYPEDGNWEEPRLEDNCLAYKAVTDGTNESFSLEITGLSPATNYCFRAYVKMKYDGKEYISYSNSQVWSTNEISAPSLKNIEQTASSVTSITVSSGIVKSGDGEITEKGFVWMLDLESGYWQYPTLEDCLAYKAVSDNNNDDFSMEITGLESNTTYYFRAYAKMKYEEQEFISYSNSQYWRTEDYSLPEFNNVVIPEEDITYSSAVLTGGFHNEGNCTILKSGFCISESSKTSQPTINNYDILVDVDDSYKATLTDLKHDTEYAVRFYATCKQGDKEETAYSGTTHFRTKRPTETTFNNVNIDETLMTSVTISSGIAEYGDGEVIERGVIWKKGYWENPTFENDYYDGYQKLTTDEKEFTVDITGLQVSTEYSFRIYVKTKVEGVEYVSYSDYASTRTSALNFNLNVTDVTTSSCKLVGIADYDLPEGITEYGFSITTEDISSYEMTDLRKGSDLNDNKEFSLDITGLTMNTRYYVGIYVKIGDKVYHADGRWEFSTKNIPTSDSNPSPDKKD